MLQQPVLRLEGPLSIADVAAAMTLLAGALRASPQLVLDVSGISQIDGAGLQLLMVAAREARSLGGSLRLHEPSRAVRAALATARLGDDLAPATAVGGDA